MDEIKLTNDADALICVLYKRYIERRKSGKSKASAKCFDGSDYIRSELMPKWSLDDVDETCRELSRAGLLHCEYADDTVWYAVLTDDSIIYMENRFIDGMKSVIAHLQSLREIIPW